MNVLNYSTLEIENMELTAKVVTADSLFDISKSLARIAEAVDPTPPPIPCPTIVSRQMNPDRMVEIVTYSNGLVMENEL